MTAWFINGPLKYKIKKVPELCPEIREPVLPDRDFLKTEPDNKPLFEIITYRLLYYFEKYKVGVYSVCPEKQN